MATKIGILLFDGAEEMDALREMGGAEVVERVRFVRDGNLLTAGGVMSGIEMSLWLVEKLYGPDVVRRTKSYIAYDHPSRATSEAWRLSPMQVRVSSCRAHFRKKSVDLVAELLGLLGEIA